MSRKFTFGGSYTSFVLDADALAFLNATGITDTTISLAINTLVVDMKGYGIWTKMKAIYPFVGGTSATHKFNLKDPRDLDVAFRLTFTGGITHNSNGINFNGVNAYARTFFLSNQFSSANSFGLSIYNRLNVDSGGQIGVFSPDLRYIASRIGGIGYFGIGNTYISNTSTDSKGFWQINRTSSSLVKAFKNSSAFASGTTGAGTLSTSEVYIGALNSSGSASFYSAENNALASISDGLSDTESANFYTAVQAFQTTLGRQV